MFAESQTSHVPFTLEDLLERPLETETAIAIDPDGTKEVDDAISVRFETSRYGKPAIHISTYIADTALLGLESQPFVTAREIGFTRYRENNESTEFMYPLEILEALSLGARQDEGSPAIAVRTRVHNGNVALMGIERVRVRVDPMSYSRFGKLAKKGDERSMEIARSGKVLQGLGYYSTHNFWLNPHDIVASHMVMTNASLAHFALKNGIPWIYRSHRGNGSTKHGTNNHLAHYTHRPRLHRQIGGMVYCHGTSPLRRFPDSADQINLAAIIEGSEPQLEVADMRDMSIETNEKTRRYLGQHTIEAA